MGEFVAPFRLLDVNPKASLFDTNVTGGRNTLRSFFAWSSDAM